MAFFLRVLLFGKVINSFPFLSELESSIIHNCQIKFLTFENCKKQEYTGCKPWKDLTFRLFSIRRTQCNYGLLHKAGFELITNNSNSNTFDVSLLNYYITNIGRSVLKISNLVSLISLANLFYITYLFVHDLKKYLLLFGHRAHPLDVDT